MLPKLINFECCHIYITISNNYTQLIYISLPLQPICLVSPVKKIGTLLPMLLRHWPITENKYVLKIVKAQFQGQGT